MLATRNEELKTQSPLFYLFLQPCETYGSISVFCRRDATLSPEENGTCVTIGKSKAINAKYTLGAKVCQGARAGDTALRQPKADTSSGVNR